MTAGIELIPVHGIAEVGRGADLVDELRLLVYPLLLGCGKRLFDDRGQATAFRHDASKASPTGVLSNRYVRAGEVRTGSFESG